MNDKVPFRMPRVLAWEVTRRCPLKCRHCRAGAADLPYARELTTAECRRALDSLAAPSSQPPPLVIWTGGEPMLRPDILALVSHATALGIRSVMAPCGMLVTEARLGELKAAGVTACSFSPDAPLRPPCGCLGGRGFAFLSHVGDLQTCGFIDTPCGNLRDHACDVRALIAAAANPLGAAGTCRTAEAAEASAHRRSIDVPCAASRAAGRARL